MKTLSRRGFLKGLTYSSVLSVGGFSSLVFGMKKTMPTIQDQKEVIDVINHTSSVVTFPGKDHAAMVSIKPGEQVSFIVPENQEESTLSANNKQVFIKDVLLGKVAIESNSSTLNGLYPDSFFDTVAA